MTELEIKLNEYVTLLKGVLELLVESKSIKKSSTIPENVRVSLEAYSHKGKDLFLEIQELKDKRENLEANDLALSILKHLMYKYMLSDYEITKDDFVTVKKAVHLLENKTTYILKSGETEFHVENSEIPDMPEDFLNDFKETCLRNPNELGKACFELAKGWYELRGWNMNDPLNEPLKL
jgi:hypothetical protein